MIAAHNRAIALDPTIVTSDPHTHFVRGEYEATIETQVGGRYYMDAACWAALGDSARAIAVLKERLAPAAPRFNRLVHGNGSASHNRS